MFCVDRRVSIYDLPITSSTSILGDLKGGISNDERGGKKRRMGTDERLGECHADMGAFFLQVRYAAQEISPAKSARARGSYLRVSFKNTRETAQAINGMKLQRALAFLDNVSNKLEAVPMRRYAGSTGRCAQGE